MQRLIDYFGAAFLVNLPERVDRLEATREELSRVGSGIGPGRVELHAPKRFAHAEGFGTPGVRSCFDSHLNCLRAAHARGTRGVLILEDDITFALALPAIVPSLISHLDTHPWDLVAFGHEKMGDHPRAHHDTTPADVKFIRAGDFETAHFYAINGTVLPRLIAFLEALLTRPGGSPEGGPMPIDGGYNFFREKNPDIVGLVTVPKLGWQRPSRSDLSPHWFDRVPVARGVLSRLRTFKQMAQRWRE